MKKLTFLAILAALAILFTNCEEEETTKVDFNIVVTGESPNAIVQITNTSDSADIYTWEFSEGANMETSEEINPQLLVDKTGEFSITLTATIGKKEISKTKKVTITGINGIYNYDDVIIGEFHNQGDYTEEYGYLFSCETGLVFKRSELSGNMIDMLIAYDSEYNVRLYSPDAVGMFIIPEPRTTYLNLNTDNSVSVTGFDNIQEDRFNSDIEYSNKYVFIEFNELPKVIPFIDNDGKIGLIKIQETISEYLLVDVKVQKYVN